MPDPSTLALFAATAFVFLIVPGPAVIYVTTRSMDQGRAAGMASVLGIHTGTVVHTVAAALGLSALLASSAAAFTVVKLLGAAYLVFLGVRRLLGSELVEDQEVPARRRSLWRIYGQGVVVNVLNPKTALFMLALLPQFVDPARGSVTGQILFLGGFLSILGLVSDGTYALVAAGVGRWLRGSPRYLRIKRYVTGGVLVALGVTAAATGSRTSE
jgi:threonine/homoserine/homoserine lactone efflux protein